ncbi:SDR family NAD(P)-dependent oxidoreductase [Vibrio mediterranei]|jgi:NAD(P)-dependent dehydrogenase (short-subunit alcohol dehydrogenase family)|uniref:SDR family NAD(P)-dependent oxidoreductase n=1 Tax=Vibrio mediterranei TaxID=689 RepID=UPI002283569A|nr:SDR family oxidoreductase [Vibrio mediterranei]MCY9856141.1 SDR family NAD(P)-dependent oxidoreductase [Vibrio mediterranei]
MTANKTVIITGASSGMGRELAKTFLSTGNNVVLNARREEAIQSFIAENHENASRIAYVVGDIGKVETGKELVKVALEAFGSIDVLINNAGTFIPKPFLEETEESLEHYYSTTVKGSYFTSQAVIPEMQKNGGGSIINMGSMWVENPIEATPASASQVAKGAMHTLTRHLAIEFAKDNIRVNTIAPAVIDTTLYDKLMDKETLDNLSALHPLNKLGQLDDIVAWTTHLAGKGSNFVTGQTFFVDGGITAGSHS